MRLRPGLCPGPRWGSLQRLPRPPSCVWEGRFAAGKGKGGEGKGREGKGREGEGWEGEEKGKEGWDEREMDPHNFENRSTPMLQPISNIGTTYFQCQCVGWERARLSSINHSILHHWFLVLLLLLLFSVFDVNKYYSTLTCIHKFWFSNPNGHIESKRHSMNVVYTHAHFHMHSSLCQKYLLPRQCKFYLEALKP